MKSGKIIVGSTNPVKVAAVQAAFTTLFAHENFEISGIVAPSGVADQPMTDAETLLGAKNRALYGKSNYSADYYIGIEGGVETSEDMLHAFAWMVIVDREGRIGKSRTATFELPPKIATLIADGIELGVADDMVFKRENSKQKDGAVGILTKGVIDRKKYYVEALMLAMIPFINQPLYFTEH